MKKCLLLISYLFTTVFASAQITVNQSDLPSVGESWVLYSDSANATVGFMSPPGANQNWNFSAGWNISDSSVYQFVNPSTLPSAGSYPGSNLGVNLITALGNAEGYMSRGATGLFLNGLVTSIPGFVDITSHNTNTVVIPVPLTYGSTFNYSQRTVSVVIYNPIFMQPATKTITTEMISYNCDAWGTLTTPSITNANVLRLRSLITGSVDSNYTDVTGTGNFFTFDNTATNPAATEYDYVFVRNGPNGYVMTCSADVSTGALTYGDYLASGTVSVQEVANQVKSVAYPNPVNDMLHLRLNGAGVSSFKMFDATGREAFTYDVNGVDRLSFSTAQFNNGLYCYFLYNNNGQVIGNGKVVVQH